MTVVAAATLLALSAAAPERTFSLRAHGGFPVLLGVDGTYRPLPALELEGSFGVAPVPEGLLPLPGVRVAWILPIAGERKRGHVELELPLHVGVMYAPYFDEPIFTAGPAIEAIVWGQDVGFTVQLGGGVLAGDTRDGPAVAPLLRLSIGVAF